MLQVPTWIMLAKYYKLTRVLSSARLVARRGQPYLQFCTRIETRSFSTDHLDPSIRGLAESLSQRQPCFTVDADAIQVLSQPPEFYQILLDMIQRAQKRVFISSLYIGEEESELIESLNQALTEKPNLHVYLTLDLNRSTRPGPSNTVQILQPLLVDHPGRVHVSLFRTPNLRGLMAKLVPPRFNEGWGTWHAKVYGADDDVMISGANLNKSYFTNRQDRYLHFKAQPSLANYCFSFLRTVDAFSYQLTPTSIEWPDASTHAHDITKKASIALRAFQRANLVTGAEKKEEDQVLIFPMIQAGMLDIREEERCIRMLYSHIPDEASVTLTSGYFGLYEPYQELALRSGSNCHIIAASPLANGFFGSKGLSGRIPEAYTLLERRFMSAVARAGRTWDAGFQKGIQLREWYKANWTYHAKGIWLSPTPTTPPILTLFGSTNLNARSAHLDTELSFLLLTSSPALRQKLAEETKALGSNTREWRGGEGNAEGGEERRVRRATPVLAALVGGKL